MRQRQAIMRLDITRMRNTMGSITMDMSRKTRISSITSTDLSSTL